MSSTLFDPTRPTAAVADVMVPSPGTMSDAEARVSTTRLADEIYARWCVAVGDQRQGESAWMAEVSHALQRAARSLGSGEAIG